ncbi:hypothetical protein V6S67_07285 [Arthrobacter sp. Soc17.1.1.1]|uniref:hypothetical protein n=1 Tax=Arthrobacter sp. Soc17.1.1.1 TaxID=3121277 RepID=UPI002FE4911D
MYADHGWEIVDVAGQLVGLLDRDNGERLTTSLSSLIAQNPPEDRFGRVIAQMNVIETLAAGAPNANDRQACALREMQRKAADAYEVLHGTAMGASCPRPGYGEGSSRWSRAHLKARELAAIADEMRARDPASARALTRSHSSLLRDAEKLMQSGLAALIDGRRSRNHTVLDGIAAEVLKECNWVLRDLGKRSRVPKQEQVARVQRRLRKKYPDADFALPPARRLGKILDELSDGQYLDGDALNRLTAANTPKRVNQARSALLPGSEIQVDSTRLDILLILPGGKIGRPECSIMVDKATRSILSFSLAKNIDGADLAFMIAQAMTLRPRTDLEDVPANYWELKSRDLPWAQMYDAAERERLDVMVPLVRPRCIETDHGRDYTSEVVESACRQLGITLVRSSVRTPTDKAVVERAFGTIKTRFLSQLPGFTGGALSSRGDHPEKDNLLTLYEFAWLLDRWIVHIWQNTPAEGLREPLVGALQPLSPNAAYQAMFPYVGFVPVPLSRRDYISLLPIAMRTIQSDGIQLEYRMYDSPGLDVLRRRTSGTLLPEGKWEVHYIPTDPRVVWVHNPTGNTYVECYWKENRLDKPFSRPIRERARQMIDDGEVDPSYCSTDATMSLIDVALSQVRKGRREEAKKELERGFQEAQRGHQPAMTTINGVEDLEPVDQSDQLDVSEWGPDDEIQGFDAVNGVVR